MGLKPTDEHQAAAHENATGGSPPCGSYLLLLASPDTLRHKHHALCQQPGRAQQTS